MSNTSQESTLFKQKEKTFLPLGGRNKIFIVPDLFNEEVYVHIREYFPISDKSKKTKKEEGEREEEEEDEEAEEEEEARPYYIPTKKGVCLNITEFEGLCEHLDKTKQIVRKLTKKLKKEASSSTTKKLKRIGNIKKQ